MNAYKMCNCIVTSSVNRKDLSVRSKTCAEAPDHFLKGQKKEGNRRAEFIMSVVS